MLFPKAAEKSIRKSNFPLVRRPEQGFNRYRMRFWGMAAIAALVLGFFATIAVAADNVAPTKAELEEMYNAAYRAFDAKKFSEALKQLDAIDARQPDLAASKNLRGVILMRQGKYDEAETALQEAARIDPKFWNARFNLAEIPFLKKDWAEARKRFEQLLSTGASDLAKEASQLIQYKILLTYLQEGNRNMVDSMLAKLELSPDTPAVDYVKAAVALQQKNQSEAKDWISAAEKNYSPQLNKLFAESLYEVGWLEKPAGEGRPSLPLMTAAERTEKIKAAARSKFEQSQQALRQGDFATALKLIDEADKADPNKPVTLNLRGEILMQQQQFEQAEAAFKKAARLDPKLREAQYNLAQIPFKKKDYAKAQERFEALYNRMPGGDKNQAAELIKFKIYMTLLLEGKESRAHAMMEEFQFTGDTPALYYAQAAWEYKHNNAEKAADWTGSANKIYSPALNSVFADAFYDVGWTQRPEGSTAPALAFDTTNVGASQAQGGPAIEPSPIPESVAVANKQGETAKTESLAFSDLAANNPSSGAEGTTLGTSSEQSAVSAPSEPLAGQTSAQPAKMLSPGGLPGAAASPSEDAAAVATEKAEQSPTAAIRPSPSAVGKTPTKILASDSWTSVTGFVTSHRTWLVGGLLLAGILFLGGAVVSQGRRYTFTTPSYFSNGSSGSPVSNPSEPSILSFHKGISSDNGFLGGPRQVSLRLTASKPLMQRTALRLIESGGAFDGLTDLRGTVPQTPVSQNAEADHKIHRVAAPILGAAAASVVAEASGLSSFSSTRASESGQTRAVAETVVAPVVEPVKGPQFGAIDQVQPDAHMPPPTGKPSKIPAVAEVAATPAMEPVAAAMAEPPAQEQAIPQVPPPTEEPSALPVVAEVAATPAMEPVAAAMAEPLPQEQAIPQVSANGMEPSTAEAVHEVPSYVPEPISSPSKIATPATMSETTETPLVPMTEAQAPPVAKPQPPPGTTHNTVELTFYFEVASVQLTPAFKVGALQVRPASKVVTMRLGPFQDSQPMTNSEVAFEIAKVALAGDGLGKIQVVRSQQQKPLADGSPSFAIAGLQFVPNLKAAPIWLTPSQEGRACVKVRARFQIGAIQFSPSFEVASVTLNSSSKRVHVQLPGLSSSSGEGAPVFEITNLQLDERGDISMMQLNLLGQGSNQT